MLLLAASAQLGALISARLAQALSLPAWQGTLTQTSHTADSPLLLIRDTATQQLECEVFLGSNPFAPVYGFMLGAAGSKEALDMAAPILDALAPIPQGWLHLGNLGAARFIEALQQTLNAEGLPVSDQLLMEMQLNHPHLLTQVSSLLAHQQEEMEKLAQIAKGYLQQSNKEQYQTYHTGRVAMNCYPPAAHESPARQIAHLFSQLGQHK